MTRPAIASCQSCLSQGGDCAGARRRQERRERTATEKSTDWLSAEFMPLPQIANFKEGGGRAGWESAVASAISRDALRSRSVVMDGGGVDL